MSCGTWRRISPSSELQSPSSVNKCSMVYASDLPKIWQESHLSHPSHLSYLFLSHQCPTLQWLRRHLSFGSLRLTCCRLGRVSALPPSVAPHGQHLPNSGRAETRRLAWLDWKHNRKIRRNSELNSAWTIDMNHDYHWLSLIINDYHWLSWFQSSCCKLKITRSRGVSNPCYTCVLFQHVTRVAPTEIGLCLSNRRPRQIAKMQSYVCIYILLLLLIYFTKKYHILSLVLFIVLFFVIILFVIIIAIDVCYYYV